MADAANSGKSDRTSPWSALRLRLRPGVALAFLVVMVPLTVGMIAFIYNQNVSLAFEMAETAMQRATVEVTEKIDSMLAPVGQAVESMAALAELDRNGLRHTESQAKVYRLLQRLPDATSLYAGFESDGAFYQVIRLRAGLVRLGADLKPVPAGAVFAVRALDAVGGQMADSYAYIKSWGQTLDTETVAVHYDPRQRPWYKEAMREDGLTISNVYVFSGTGNLGLTVSRRITDEIDHGVGHGVGHGLGVVGADLSLGTLAKFLENRRVGEHGVVFIMDEDGRLIGHPQADLAVSRHGDQVAVVKADQAADPVVAEAVRKRNGGAGDRFRDRLGQDGREYLVAFHPFPSTFGRAWTIGIAAPADEFVGPIQRASLMFLAVGAVAILVAVLAAILLSRLLTRPIQALILESNRIRHFDLETRPMVRSGIVDVDNLADAIDGMKSGLRSFGAYVPKELVRQIIASGGRTEVGGTRRPLTILFSDIKGFTGISESLMPEDVLERLSQYFNVMSHAIHDTGGAVDKFIGDAVMAMWNAPIADDDHAVSACRAVLACIEAEDSLNAVFIAKGYAPLHTRFGLHTGNAVVGNVGSRDRMQYTALGAMVNLASRVEGLNKKYGTRALITGPVEQAVRDHFLVRKVDIVIPVGTSLPTPLFELVGDRAGASEAATTRCRLWAEAFSAYQTQDWAQAIDVFQSYLGQYSDDLVGAMLLARCRGYQAVPPPAGWDGAVRFESK